MPDIRVYIDDIEWDTDEANDLPTLVRLDFKLGEERSEEIILDRLSEEYGWCITDCRIHAVTDEEEPEGVSVGVDDYGCTGFLEDIVYDTVVDGVDQRGSIKPDELPEEMTVEFTATTDHVYHDLIRLAKEEATMKWPIVSADIEVKTHD